MLHGKGFAAMETRLAEKGGFLAVQSKRGTVLEGREWAGHRYSLATRWQPVVDRPAQEIAACT